MLNIAICDDDKYICSEIENIIIEYAKETKTAIETEVFYSGEDLYGYMQKDSRIDLVFMDIELGSTTGIAVSQHIRNILDNHSVKIVFITSKDGYEAELFDVQPFNFIKKPVTKQSVSKCLDLLVKLSDKYKVIFEYSINRTVFKEDVKNIMYFENNLRKVKIVTKNGVNYFNSTLAQVKEKLPDYFLEPHGSFLVNYDYIRQIGENELVMVDGHKIEISRRYKKNIREYQIKKAREQRNVDV